MNESDRNRLALDILAAEYALGVMQGAARTQLARLIATDPILRDMVDRWERLLAPLVEMSPDVRPSLSVWNNIQRATIERMPQPLISTRTAQVEHAPKTSGIAASLAFWRSIAAVNSILTIGCASALLYLYPVEAPPPPPREPDIGQKLAVLVDRQRVASWLMRTDGSGKRLTINPLRALLPLDEQNYVLWLVLERGQAPVNLGVLPDFGRVIDPLPDDFAKADQIGITLEQTDDDGKTQPPFLSDMTYLGPIVSLEARSP